MAKKGYHSLFKKTKAKTRKKIPVKKTKAARAESTFRKQPEKAMPSQLQDTATAVGARIKEAVAGGRWSERIDSPSGVKSKFAKKEIDRSKKREQAIKKKQKSRHSQKRKQGDY